MPRIPTQPAAVAAASEPADESQPSCALTGEPFETFWHAQLEEWHYRGAVRLKEPSGGVPAGKLVLAKAVPREGGPLGVLQPGSVGDVVVSLAESRDAAAELAIAAAGAAKEDELPPVFVADGEAAGAGAGAGAGDGGEAEEKERLDDEEEAPVAKRVKIEA